EARATAPAQAGLLDHLDHVGRRDPVFQDPAQRAVAAGLEVVLVGPRLVEVQRRIDSLVLLRRGADGPVAFGNLGGVMRHLALTHFSPSSSSSTFSVVSFSW